MSVAVASISEEEARTLNPLTVLSRCLRWRGRFSRGEFAVAYLTNITVLFVAAVIVVVAFDGTATEPSPAVQFVPLVLGVIGFCVSVGATFRRLNDLGMSPWWLLAMFAPLLNLALLLALFFVRTNPNAPALATSSGVPVVATVAVGLLLVGIVAAIAVPGVMRARISGNEASAIGGIRAMLSAQTAYAARNQGLFESQWKCLSGHCIPGFSGEPFLSEYLTQSPRSGYRWTLLPAQTYAEGAAPADVSPSSTNGYVVVAEPEVVNSTGVRTFCGDSLGTVCSADTSEGLVEQFEAAPFIRCASSCTVLQPARAR